jgi:N-acetylglucosaminyl-diphospho-decaprenol L-rhamnosyltransferase
MTADVRIGIVSWNTAELLDRALGSLPKALGNLSAEVVVVDNASSDASADVALGYGVEVIRNGSNVGYAQAMNAALSGTGARALIALNPDTESPPDSLNALVSTLDEHPRAGLVAPVLLDSDGTPQQSVYPYPGIGQALETGFLPKGWRRNGHAFRRRSARLLPRRWVVGAVHCIRRDALGGEAPYSTRWFMYVEDVDLCWRLERRGWQKLLREDVAVVHRGNASGAQRWGQGADLELRSIPNIYEWIATERSPLIARTTSLVNVLGVTSKMVALKARSATSDGLSARASSERADELGKLAAHHRHVLFSRTRLEE